MDASEKRYYLLDARSCVGNCASWWAPGGKGYVCDLRDAGKFTEKEAFSHRDTDVPVPCEVAEAAVVQHVRVDTPALGDYWRKGNNAHLRAMGKRAKR